MDQLPTELFNKILFYLSLHDKINCVVVCKLWQRLIENANLYKMLDLDLLKNPEKVNRVLLFLYKDPSLGLHVRHLSIQGSENVGLTTSLTTLFPNIKSLEWMESQKVDGSKSKDNQSTIMPPPKELTVALRKWKNLESIVDHSNHHFSLQISTNLLESITFLNLKHLDVTFNDFVVYRMGHKLHCRNMMVSLINNIQNAPSLEHLVLRKTAITLMDMENLHTKLPKLQKLVLQTVYLNTFDMLATRGCNNIVSTTAAEKVILKAKRLEYFSMNSHPQDEYEATSFGFQQTLINWATYIGDNYTNISHFDFDCSGYTMKQGGNAAVESVFADVISKMHKLTHYNGAKTIYPSKHLVKWNIQCE